MEPLLEGATIGEPGDPCKDCGQPSIDGFWCQGCTDDAIAMKEVLERERAEAGIPPCDFFERMLKRYGHA